jgi:general secretion pathway protein D
VTDTVRPARRAARLLSALLPLLTIALAASPAAAQGRTGAPANDPRFSRGDELVQLDFKDVELAVVIETIARITGKNFIYDDRVRGRVTIVSPSEVTVDQAYAVFESVLKIKGFTAVPGPGGVFKIVPVRDAKESSIDTIKDDRPSANRDLFVTRLVPLLYIDAEAITNTIKPLVSKDASIVAYAPTNTIIITDTESNIRRLLTILDAIDVESYKEELAVIKIKHADAATLGEQISEIYGAEVTSSTPAVARRPARSRRARRAVTPNQPQATSPSQPGVRIITDERTNSLLVLAARSALEEIRDLVRQLDVPLTGSGRIHVYYLKHADAEELAETLNGMLSGQQSTPTSGPGRTGAAAGAPQALRSTVTALAEGITVNPDPATNSLVVQASKEAYEALTSVIEKLDIPRPQVLVEAMILEVDVTDGIDLGVEWTINAINGDQEFFFSTASAAAGGSGAGEIAGVIKRNFQVDENGEPLNPQPDGSNPTGTNFDAVLRAAAQDSNLNLVSAPHILTSDNEEAEIRIGNNIPIITSRVQSATGNTAGLASSVNVERQDIGVTLRVTPQISEGESLRMKIFQELTDINENLQSGVGDPDEVGVALSSRKIENTVVVKDSETVVVGGLISDRWAEGERKVPFLGDIPGLGWAFKSTSKDLRKINLIVFLTPHIVRNADEMELESIRKRGEFETGSGEKYEAAEDEVATAEAAKDEDKWSSSKSPVLGRLREHASRYTLSRKEELEELLRDREEERVEERLRAGEGTTTRVFTLRVAIFRDEDSAAEALTTLLDAGYDGSLISGGSDGGLLYELVVGPYTEVEDAQDASYVLSEAYGYDPTIRVVEIERDSADDMEPSP